MCGNPACAGGWLTFMKDHRRPMFEGRWGCTAGCLEAMVRRAVRRESGVRHAEERDSGHRHRLPLGLVLLAQGRITTTQLEQALDRQRRAGRGRIGRWLMEEYGLDPDCIARALAVQWGCPVLAMEGFDPERMALAAPRLLVEQLGMVPLRMAGERTLQLAFRERPDAAAAFALERMTGLKVESGLAAPAEWMAAQQRLCACDFVEAEFEQVAEIGLLPRRIAAALGRMRPRAARLVRAHEFFWLRMWLEADAMDSRAGSMPRTREDVADRLYAIGAEQ